MWAKESIFHMRSISYNGFEVLLHSYRLTGSFTVEYFCLGRHRLGHWVKSNCIRRNCLPEGFLKIGPGVGERLTYLTKIRFLSSFRKYSAFYK